MVDLAARAGANGGSSISVPQFAYRADLDRRTWGQLLRFEQQVARDHATSDDPDPVFFGLNTSLWFKSLFERDVGELGVDAIVTSGVMLWGRFQKTPQAQRKAEAWLRSIAARARAEFILQRPDPELWWEPVWLRAVRDPQATPQVLAAILQRVRQDQSLTPSFQGDLVPIWLDRFMLDYHDHNKAFDVHEEVQRLLAVSPISVGGRRRGGDTEAAVSLGRDAMRRHWDLVNKRLEEIYPQALAEEDLLDCITRVTLLRDALNLRLPPARLLPRPIPPSVAGPQWEPIARELIRVAETFLDPLPPPAIQMQKGILIGAPPAVAPVQHTVLQLALCGFSLKQLGHSRTAECFQRIDALPRGGSNLTSEQWRRVSELRDGIWTEPQRPLVQIVELEEIVGNAQEGGWGAALSSLHSVTDPDKKMETLARLTNEYRDQALVLTLEEGGAIQIGRKPENDLIVRDQSVSGQHATLSLRRTPTGLMEVVIIDRGSRNGTVFGASGLRLTPNYAFTIPPGQSVILGQGTTLYNGLEDALGAGPFILKAGLAPGEWVIQDAAQGSGTADPDWLDRLPKGAIETIPEQYRYLIPDKERLKEKVMFQRFKQMVGEMASMVASPARIGVRFFGPPGTGKTTIPDFIAAWMGVPLLRYTFSPRTDPSDVEGMWAYELVPVIGADGGPETGSDGKPRQEYKPVFKEGVATVAMENGFHLVWDEPDLARPGVLAFLNNVSAPGEYAWVRKGDGSLQRIKVHTGYRCHVTENGVREIAREEHGEDFLRRFVPYYVGPWTVSETTQVLSGLYEVQGAKRNWSRTVSQVLATVHDRISFLASSYEDPVTHVPMIPLGAGIQQTVQFTPRSVLRLAERLIRSGPMTPETLSRAIRSEYILPLADSGDRELVWQQIQPILAPLVQEMGWAPDAIGPHAIPTPTLKEIERKYLGGRRVPQNGFAWTQQVLRLADETLWNRQLGIDVMWLGDAGMGKTRIPEQLSMILGVNHFSAELSGETEEGDLVGRNRRNGFQPGIVTLGVEEGGVVHMDECLLLSPGRFESVFGPLMDDAQALFIKNPYRRIPRRPGETFFLFTSNPPFGNYAGKDRYEQSGAAMSRMAVICLTGELAMQDDDRLDILKHRPPPPAVRVSIPVKKKALTSDEASSPVRFMAEPTLTPSEGLPAVVVHPDFRKDYRLPQSLVVDPVTFRVLEPDGLGGFQEASEETMKGLERLSEYLTRRTQWEMTPVVGRVIEMRFRFFGDQTSDLASKRATYNIIDLLRFSMLGALGVGKHEWAHPLIDAGHQKYDAHEPGRLLANAMGDPRMQEFVASLAGGLFRDQVNAVNETTWPLVWDEEKKKIWLAANLPHEQFADAVICFWRTGEIMSWIEDAKVRDALEEAKPYLTAAFQTLPKSMSDDDVWGAVAEFYQQVDQVWPIYERLFPEGIKKITQRLENGERPEDIIGEVIENLLKGLGQGLPPPEERGEPGQPGQASEGPQGGKKSAPTLPGIGAKGGVPPDTGDLEGLAKKILDARAGILADRHEPRDPERFAERKGQIQQAQASMAGDQGASPSTPPQPRPPDGGQGLSPEDLKGIEVGIRDVDQRQAEGNLYRRLIMRVPRAAQLLARVKKVLPPSRPTHLEGHFQEGVRPDPQKMLDEEANPEPDGRVMLRKAAPSEVEGNIVVATDVSTSMVLSGADKNAMIASAVSIYLSEGLNLRYGELVFGSKVQSVKPLGKRLGTYLLKNEMLNKKQQAFSDPEINQSTDIRSALAKAIEWIKAKRSKADHIILITDGGENITDYPKTLEELEAECEKEEIELMILAMGAARVLIPLHFKPGHYRIVAPDGSDIPDVMVELFEKAHRRRLPRR